MIETLEPLVKGLCIFVTAMVIFVLAVMVAYLILNMCNKADAVSVVRCRDCIHRKESNTLPPRCEVFDWFSKKNDYCSFAERKSK